MDILIKYKNAYFLTINKLGMKKKTVYLAFMSMTTFVIYSCSKNDCHSCHYYKNNAEVELGEKCGEEIETLEANGYTDSTGTYEVHCHDH